METEQTPKLVLKRKKQNMRRNPKVLVFRLKQVVYFEEELERNPLTSAMFESESIAYQRDKTTWFYKFFIKNEYKNLSDQLKTFFDIYNKENNTSFSFVFSDFTFVHPRKEFPSLFPREKVKLVTKRHRL